MSQNGNLASRWLVAVVAGLLAVALLASSVTASSVAGWIWILALTMSAGLLGWTHSLYQGLWAALGAYATGATAAFVILVDKLGFSGVVVPAMALVAVAVPFYVAWQLDRRQVLSLAVAYILVAAIPVLLIQAVTDYEEVLITLYVLLAIGVALTAIYRTSRTSGAR